MANKFVTVEYDKFENKGETKMNYPYTLWLEIAGQQQKDFSQEWVTKTFNTSGRTGFWPTISAELRHVSDPNNDVVIIDLVSSTKDWLFLSSGNIIININNVENITLEPHESYSETREGLFNEIRCEESCYYIINQEILHKICEAKSIDFRIRGRQVIKDVNANGFINYAQRFYNGVYDENTYIDSLNITESEQNNQIQSQSNSGKSCMITIITMISAISSLIACLFLIVGFA